MYFNCFMYSYVYFNCEFYSFKNQERIKDFSIVGGGSEARMLFVSSIWKIFVGNFSTVAVKFIS